MGSRGSKKEATELYQWSWAGARASTIRPLDRSCQDIRVVRGSFERIASSPPGRNANVASTTTAGRVPPASSPILARSAIGSSRRPSTVIASGAIANAVSDARSASSACDFGWLAARAMIRSVGSPVPAV